MTKHTGIIILFCFWRFWYIKLNNGIVNVSAQEVFRSWFLPSNQGGKLHWWGLQFYLVFLILSRIWMEIMSYNVACHAGVFKIMRY